MRDQNLSIVPAGVVEPRSAKLFKGTLPHLSKCVAILSFLVAALREYCSTGLALQYSCSAVIVDTNLSYYHIKEVGKTAICKWGLFQFEKTGILYFKHAGEKGLYCIINRIVNGAGRNIAYL